MKTTIYSLFIIFAFIGCTNSEDVKESSLAAYIDSTMLTQVTQRDSETYSYFAELQEIGKNIDRIRTREKIITINAEGNEGENTDSVVEKTRELDDWITFNDKKMNLLQERLKEMTTKNNDLEGMVAYLTHEIAENDIVPYQDKLFCFLEHK